MFQCFTKRQLLSIQEMAHKVHILYRQMHINSKDWSDYMDIKVTNVFKSESKKEIEASFNNKVIQLLKQRIKI